MVEPGFGTRLAAVIAERGRLCVGIDPHAALLADWGLPDTASGARDFGLRVVDAVAGRAGIVKPQVGFFERHGSAGYAALEEVLAAARAARLLVIADVKRGDIASTVEGYADAWLTPGSPLEADAMTAVAYQGVGSLDGVFRLAERSGKGVFVLAATSNPEAGVIQRAVRSDGASVALGILRELAKRGSARIDDPFGALGVVLGGTLVLADYGIHAADLARIPVLAPGFGQQGARFSDLPRIYGAALPSVIPSASRSLVSAGPDGLAGAIDAARAEVALACRA